MSTSISLETAIAALKSHSVEGKATQMAAYHKADRTYLGVANPMIDIETRKWRADLDVAGRIDLAKSLWDSDVHEARIAAAKLLTQARLRPDDAAWALIKSWVPDFNAWAIADHACTAGSKRLVADPSRIDEVEEWTKSKNIWTRRAAMVITLPWTKQNNPKPADLEIRERVLGWAALYVQHSDWFIQKSVSWWLRDLSKHDPDRTRQFIAEHGKNMKKFAKKDATRRLPPL